MGKRVRAAMTGLVALAVAGLVSPESRAADAPGVRAAKPPTEFSAQRRRTRILVRPVYSYPEAYGNPQPHVYLPPNAVRQCTSWLQPENRPSGPVITPQMRCVWVGG